MDQRQSPSPTESETPSRPAPSPPAHSHLAALPNELLGQIFSHLRPDPEPSQQGGYTDLLALCVTCRGMGAVALRAMCDTVVVRSERDIAQLLTLLTLLIQYPERRSWIRNFRCLASLSGRMGDVPCGPRRVEPLPRAAHLYLTAGLEEHSNSKLAAMFDVLGVRELDNTERSEFRQRLYYALLCLMPALQALEFPADITGKTWAEFDRRCRVPQLSSMAKRQPALHPTLVELLHLGFQGSTAKLESSTALVPCSNVKSLTFSSVEGPWSLYQAIPLLHFPTLKAITLEFRGDFWSPALLWRPCKPEIWPTPVDPATIFALVKHLYMFPRKISSQAISSLAEVAPMASQPETLEIGGARPNGPLFSTYDCRWSPTLNHGILQHFSNTLRRLAVYGKWATLWDCRVLFGHRQKLVDLDRLIRLEELVAPSFAIFGALFMEKREASSWLHRWRCEPFLPMPASFNPDNLQAPENVPEYADPTNSGDPRKPDKLVQVARTTKLPPALKVLEIYEDDCSDYRWTKLPHVQWSSCLPRSSGKLFRFIKEFAFNFRNRFPKIERVVFWDQDWRGCTPQWTDEEVQEVKEVFLVQGVEFMYRECADHGFGAPGSRLRP